MTFVPGPSFEVTRSSSRRPQVPRGGPTGNALDKFLFRPHQIHWTPYGSVRTPAAPSLAIVEMGRRESMPRGRIPVIPRELVRSPVAHTL